MQARTTCPAQSPLREATLLFEERGQIRQNWCFRPGVDVETPPRLSVCVAAASGVALRTISPGLHMPNWRASQSPSAWWANTLAQNVGIENLLLDNRTAGAGSITVFFNAYKSSMKNIASIGGGARSHVDMQWSSNLVVRD